MICQECPSALFAYDWRKTRCREIEKDIFEGPLNWNACLAYDMFSDDVPFWCPKQHGRNARYMNVGKDL